MRKTALTFAILGLFATIVFASPAEAKTFKSCNDLRKTYKYGIAQTSQKAKQQGTTFHLARVSASLYNQNRKLDVDKDGVACEVKKPTTKAKAALVTLPLQGKACPTLNERRSQFDRTFSCLKTPSGKRWSRGELNLNYVYSTDDGYSHARSSFCGVDQDAGPEWAKFQMYMKYQVNRCPHQLRFLTYEMGKTKPKSSLSNLEGSSQPCKASNPTRGNWIKGFEDPERRLKHNVLGRNSVIQIIPIFAPDTAVPEGSPTADYQKYFEFVKRFVSETSDLPVNFEIRVPDQYFEFSKPLKPFGVSHSLPSPHPSALNEIMAEVDQHIDFSGATTALVLVPAGTAQDVWQQGPLGFYRSAEATLIGVSSQYPATETLLSVAPEFLNLSVPAWWVHEFFHVGVNFDDHYGDTLKSRALSGMGHWGLMSPAITDLLGWEKWLLDYTSDSQVACLQRTGLDQTVWLRPGSVNTAEQKLAVVPLSGSKVLVMESVRGAGLNHHLLPLEQGLLVYTVDPSNREHGFGFDLVYPATRQFVSGSFPGSFAPLKVGEKVEVEGVSVEVVEAGTFGDVIRLSTQASR